MTELQGKNIAVVGLGIEGLSTVVYLLRHDSALTVLDEREEAYIDKKTLQYLQDNKIKAIFGKDAFQELAKYQVLFRSPGVKFLRPEIQDAIKKGVEVTSQTKYFFDHCHAKIVGVTGTKGKGTTSSLIYEMLKKDNKDAYLGGNIGQPPLDFLDTISPHSFVVLELSSFQLQDLKKSPSVAVLLMITSEHLDHHKNTEEYVAAKRNIVAQQTAQDIAIINTDYLASRESDVATSAHVLQVSRETNVREGAFLKDGAIWIKQRDKEFNLIYIEDVLLPGKHNLENVMAASLAALELGIEVESIVSVLKTFKGLEHRLELVREVQGVKYYDDSFSTTTETAIAAIEAFTSPEILILGGSTKHANFQELGYTVSHKTNIKAIIGVGEEWKRIKEAIRAPKSSMLFIENETNMQQIVNAAAKIAEPGDVVLLSPACASFGMFKNYKDRGEQFTNEVNKL